MKFKILAFTLLLLVSGVFSSVKAQTEINITAGSKTYPPWFVAHETIGASNN